MKKKHKYKNEIHDGIKAVSEGYGVKQSIHQHDTERTIIAKHELAVALSQAACLARTISNKERAETKTMKR